MGGKNAGRGRIVADALQLLRLMATGLRRGRRGVTVGEASEELGITIRSVYRIIDGWLELGLHPYSVRIAGKVRWRVDHRELGRWLTRRNLPVRPRANKLRKRVR